MKKKKLPKSLRKFIRKEKARIRREISDIEEQTKLINELYQKFSKIKPTSKIKKNYEKQKVQQVG